MTELSIFIPCYNYARYLPTSLDSILSQHYTDYELILIDDGSTDDTWAIMQEYAAKHPKISIFKNKKNIGIYPSYQERWEESQGKYLHFFTADDLYHPHCLSKVMNLFENHPNLGLVCTDIEYFEDGKNSRKQKKLLPGSHTSRVFTRNEMIPLFQSTQFWIPGVACFVKREIFKKYGNFDPSLENIADWFYFHKISLHEGIGYIPEVLISMRQHDQTYTARVKRDKKRRRATYRRVLEEFHQHKDVGKLFKLAGLHTFIFKELSWKLRLDPRYFSFWRYLKKDL
jgi:glycosyltransferase involved in cell wall biosynthesis